MWGPGRLVEEVDPFFEGRSTFAVHVLREGLVAHDPAGDFADLAGRYSLDEPVRNNQSDLLLRLELYVDLAWCQGLYLYCLSDLYSIGRAAAFTILGRTSNFGWTPRPVEDSIEERARSLLPDA